MLTTEQIQFFDTNGYLVVDDVVSPALLARLRQDFDAWVEESRGHASSYGEMADGRARFDLEPGHSAAAPALRRVSSPAEISEAYFEAMSASRMVEAVADLIGPDVKLHHTKINSKLPNTPTKVEWHQDFPFTPHSNDDLVTALLMVDEVTEENGPLEVLPGSHKGPIETLWHDGRFTGAVDPATTQRCQAGAALCTGKGRFGLPDAHPPAARLGAEPVRRAAHALYRGVLGGGRRPARGQPGAEPQRGPGRARPSHGDGAHHAVHAGAAAEAEGRFVLRAASGSCGLTGRAPQISSGPLGAPRRRPGG